MVLVQNGHFSKVVNPWFWSKNGHFSNFCFWAIQARKMSFTIFQSKKMPFQAIKRRSSKSRKIDIFPKGLTHGFDTKKGHFSNFFFQELQARKMSFTKFQTEKTPFNAIKTSNPKSGKIDIFPKVLVFWFWSKNGHFSNFFFQEMQARKMSFMIFQSEETSFQAIKTRSSRSRKIDMFPKGLTHGFGPKLAIFPTFFLGNIRHENVFYDILQRENALLGYKNKKFKRWKN